MLPVTVQFIVAMLAYALNERMARKAEDLREENRVLEEAIWQRDHQRHPVPIAARRTAQLLPWRGCVKRRREFADTTGSEEF